MPKFRVVLYVGNYEMYEVEAENEENACDKVMTGAVVPIDIQATDATIEELTEI